MTPIDSEAFQFCRYTWHPSFLVSRLLGLGSWKKVQVKCSCSYVIPQQGHPTLLSFIFFPHSIFVSTNVFESNYSRDEMQGTLWFTHDFYRVLLYYLSCPLLRHYYVPGTSLGTSYASIHLTLKANLWSLGAFHIWQIREQAQRFKWHQGK